MPRTVACHLLERPCGGRGYYPDGQLVRGTRLDPPVAGFGLLRCRFEDIPALDDRAAAFDCCQRVVDEGDDARLVGDLCAVERVLDLFDVVAGLRFSLGQAFLEEVVGDLVGQVGADDREGCNGQQQGGEDRAELQGTPPAAEDRTPQEAQPRFDLAYADGNEAGNPKDQDQPATRPDPGT